MTVINSRQKILFEDWDKPGPAQRSFTFDECTLVALAVETLVQRNTRMPGGFRVDAALRLLAEMASREMPSPEKYLRPMLGFLQGLVNAGLLVETTPTARIGGLSNIQREFAAGHTLTIEGWARNTAVAALGLPYVAHVFSDVAVRVHRGPLDADPVASGIVLTRDWVLTNNHVVEGADQVCVSWRCSAPIYATKVIASITNLDLAMIHVPGFEANPVPWLRRPNAAEPVIILAYPEIPQVASRPLMKFTGWVATDEPVTTYIRDQQLIIVSAVMGPGSSGGPIFGADGCLLGIVVQTLEGKKLEDGTSLQSTFHAALPADLILEEVRSLDKRLAVVNKWAGADTCK